MNDSKLEIESPDANRIHDLMQQALAIPASLSTFEPVALTPLQVAWITGSLLAQQDAQIAGYLDQHARDSTELRALCQARDDARKERDGLKAQIAELTKRCEAVETVAAEEKTLHGAVDYWQARAAELQAQVEALWKDEKRLDHLQTTGSTVELLPGMRDARWRFRIGGLLKSENTDLRAAIDAAMQQQKAGENE